MEIFDEEFLSFERYVEVGMRSTTRSGVEPEADVPNNEYCTYHDINFGVRIAKAGRT